MTRVNVTALRARLREVLARVTQDECIEISRRGQVVALLLDPDQARTQGCTSRLETVADLQELYRAKRNAYTQTGQRTLTTVGPEVAQGLLDELRWHRSM